MSLNKEQITEALTRIADPKGGDIVSSGVVRALSVEAGTVRFVLEIDPETGMVEILKYALVDDCGTRLNPATVEGQTQGSVAQGIGAALLEEYVYDDDGNLLTSTYMDYLLPTINDALVPLGTRANEVPAAPNRIWNLIRAAQGDNANE